MPRHSLEKHTHSEYADKSYIDNVEIELKDILNSKATFDTDGTSNIMQLYLNPSKTVKAYPKVLASEVYMPDGSKITDHVTIGGIAADNYYSKNHIDSLFTSERTQSDSKYVVKENGKGLSSNDFTSEEKSKLASLQIADVTKNYVDTHLAKKANVSHQHKVADITDLKLSTVAKTGSYNDLIDKPDFSNVESLREYINTEVSKKANTVHNHSVTEITDFPENIATEDYVREEVSKAQAGNHVHLADNVQFSNSQPVIESLGGIKTGETLNGLSVEQVLSKLLYKHVNQAVSANCYPNGGTFEYGDQQTVTSITAVVSKKTNPITKVEFLDGDVILEEKTDGVANGGIFTLSGLTIPVNTSKSFTIKATANGEDGNPLSISASTGRFNFIYPYYWGLCSSTAPIDQSLIKSLEKKLESKTNKTITVNSDYQKLVFAYPKSYGPLKQIYDSNNFDVTSTFTVREVAITGRDNKPQSYYVYVNTAFTATNFTFKFNY